MISVRITTQRHPDFMITTDRRSLAESVLWLDGTQFSLHDYPMYDAYYKGMWKNTLLKCGRQVGKSISAAAFTLADVVSTPFFKTMYVSPSLKQTSAFSNTRIAKMIQHSPLIRDNFLSPSAPDNVFLKILKNGSELIFSYASDNPDRARGYTADRINFDEIQDILYDEVIPVIAECAANSPYGFMSYTGTPKTMENTIEFLWRQSTQGEWCIKCHACGSYSFYISDAGIGKSGPVCLKCKKNVNPRDGIWVDMNPIPENLDPSDPANQRVKAFHIPQIILPQNHDSPERWGRIRTKLEKYGDSQFKNEVLGISDSVGARFISLDELISCCKDYSFNDKPDTAIKHSSAHVVGGVDWSGGGTSGHSRTAAWIWGVDSGGRYTCLWYKIFNQENPIVTVKEIARVMQVHSVSLIVCDAGEGHMANAQLRQLYGDNRVWAVQYGASEGDAPPFRWNGRDRYLVDRTTMIDNFLMEVKHGQMSYPTQKLSMPAFDDVMNVYEEVTAMGKRVWRHEPSCPDDALHAQVFAWIAGRIKTNNLTFYGK